MRASGKAGDHEWEPIEKGRGYCSCGFGRLISFFLSREEWQAHLTFMQAEQEAKPVASSAHFPRITKHDLEVVVEAMDKLREALRVEEEGKTTICDNCRHDNHYGKHGAHSRDCPCWCNSTAAPPSVDGLEAQDNLKRRILVHLQNALFIPDKEEKQIVDEMEYFIRTRDRELVEKLEGLAKEWEQYNAPITMSVRYHCAKELRAVLATRNEGGG